ncbi:hypothetical protein SEA_FINNY_36 [Microbacterium phage Finny]|uniref:DNA-binding phage zinc finger domain-containing protein n=2 Tax=Elerivirus eleri TaxID=2560589 RepID=A0A514U413_9CAUD|nr:hypothetical protein SEA_FINNY_36 [Microbacterium phage Finny]QDK03696.1 hypothetical protein SEA_MCUBED_36 [Microbacterium phage MCubed]WNN93837.1 hypothetical protein SEA_ZENITSU_36 [Microbacterium phage Zenitsu]
MKKAIDHKCDYCEAQPGEPCVVTLAPEVGPLSIKWAHRAREEAVL